MPPGTEPGRPFFQRFYTLGSDRAGRPLALDPLVTGEADVLGRAFAAIDPWLSYRLAAHELAGFFTREEEGASRYAIRNDGRLAGVVVMRVPWLNGPYLQFLGVLEPFRSRGVGEKVLTWIEEQARASGARNTWLCVTGTNTNARRFYERHGYALAAEFDGLVADGIQEVLMRKR
ncbi:MAG: GNAT family N-acetyltransferase, partial [Hyphomicrobiaceae bacterium]